MKIAKFPGLDIFQHEAEANIDLERSSLADKYCSNLSRHYISTSTYMRHTSNMSYSEIVDVLNAASDSMMGSKRAPIVSDKLI